MDMNLYSSGNQNNLRRVNFTQHEKLLLLSLIEKNKTWLMHNSYDISTVSRKKSEVWREITRDFNLMSKSYCPRDTRQLRKCWENLKTRYRKNARMQSKSERVSPASNSEGMEVESTLENETLYSRIAVLVDEIDPLRSSSSTSGNKNFDHSDSDQQPLNSIVLGDENEQFASITTTKHQNESTNRSSPKEPFIKLEVPEEKHDLIITHENLSEKNNRKSPESVEEDVSIVEVTSAKTPAKTTTFRTAPERSGAANSLPQKMFKLPVNYSYVESAKSPFLKPTITSGSLRKRLLYFGNSRNGHKVFSAQKRPYSSVRSDVTQTRLQTVDTEKALRIKFLRNRIREQEMRLRLMQQRLRHERERHEAMMTLLHKKSAHYEQEINRVQDQFNDDSDLCDDWPFSDA